MTLQKIATITFLDTSCLMSNFTVFFLDKKLIFSGRARAGKIFQLGALPPMPPLASCLFPNGRFSRPIELVFAVTLLACVQTRLVYLNADLLS